MAFLKKYLKSYSGLLLISVIATIFSVGAALWQPHILQNVLNAVMKDNKADVNRYGLQLMGIALVGLVAGIVNTIVSASTAQGVTTDIRSDGFKKIQTYSFANIEKFSAGNLSVRLTNDITQIQNVIMMTLQTILRIPFFFIGAFILAMQTLPQLWWIIVGLVIVIIIIMGVIVSRMGPKFSAIQRYTDKVNSIVKGNLMGIRIVKSFVQEDNEGKRFSETSDNLEDQTESVGTLFAFMVPTFFLAANIAIFISILCVGTMVQAHPSRITAIASFISYLMQIMVSIIMGGMMMMYFSRGAVSIRRVNEIFEADPDIKFKDTEDKDIDGSVEFKGVNFRYPEAEHDTLKNINFKIEPGEHIGIVGATGSGKTTLAQLIPRVYDATSGEVDVGNYNVKDLNEKNLHHSVSIVLQKPILFSGTISDNLRQGNENANVNDMEYATSTAQATEFINNKEDKFESKVEERGSNFSGGQKQRLSISRGIIGKPKVLILDDSTSALDAKSEELVKEGIQKNLKDTTTIIISQKISSVVNADRIFVMDNGEIVGIGTHEELVRNNSVYQEIYNTQKGKVVDE